MNHTLPFFVQRMVSHRAFLFLGVVVVASGLVACGDRAGAFQSDEEAAVRDSVLTVLSDADRSFFMTAFDRLSDYEYIRYMRTEQYDEDDYLLAFDEVQIRVEGADAQRVTRIERTDSAGSFDFGLFNRFVSENVESVDPVDLVPYVLPDDIGYKSPRNAKKYSYRILPDTLLWDRQAMVVEINAKPESGDGLNIRIVRQYIDRETNVLVAVYLERVDLALLFREESAFYVDLRPAPDGVFLPNNTRFQTRIRMPFRGTYTIRTVSTYSDFRNLAAQ